MPICKIHPNEHFPPPKIPLTSQGRRCIFHKVGVLTQDRRTGYPVCKSGIQVRAQHCSCHDDVIKWRHFPRYWPFVRGIHRSPVNSPHKGKRRGALMFYLICVWINGWVNNPEVGDLIHHRAHYDVIVMVLCYVMAPGPRVIAGHTHTHKRRQRQYPKGKTNWPWVKRVMWFQFASSFWYPESHCLCIKRCSVIFPQNVFGYCIWTILKPKSTWVCACMFDILSRGGRWFSGPVIGCQCDDLGGGPGPCSLQIDSLGYSLYGAVINSLGPSDTIWWLNMNCFQV